MMSTALGTVRACAAFVRRAAQIRWREDQVAVLDAVAPTECMNILCWNHCGTGQTAHLTASNTLAQARLGARSPVMSDVMSNQLRTIVMALSCLRTSCTMQASEDDSCCPPCPETAKRMLLRISVCRFTVHASVEERRPQPWFVTSATSRTILDLTCSRLVLLAVWCEEGLGASVPSECTFDDAPFFVSGLVYQ